MTTTSRPRRWSWEPGIRLFHSRDLQRWSSSGTLWRRAPHDLRGLASHEGDLGARPEPRPGASGLFYLAYSVMRSTAARYFDVDNYVVSAPSIEGPWSAPAYLNSVGFDPSLLHDVDGRHWLVALEWDPRDGYEHPGAIVLTSTTRTEAPGRGVPPDLPGWLRPRVPRGPPPVPARRLVLPHGRRGRHRVRARSHLGEVRHDRGAVTRRTRSTRS